MFTHTALVQASGALGRLMPLSYIFEPADMTATL